MVLLVGIVSITLLEYTKRLKGKTQIHLHGTTIYTTLPDSFLLTENLTAAETKAIKGMPKNYNF